jgi:multidrug resistance efflux pump
VRRLRVDLANAGVEVARVPVRAEILSSFDAQIAEVDARIDEVARLLDEEQVLCPVDGVVDIGTGLEVVRVDQLQPVYLDIPIPVNARHRIREGAEVLFTTGAVNRTTFRGVLVEVATNDDAAQGRPVFWASASVDNPDLLLRRGMTGTVLIALDGEDFSAVARFRRKLLDPWRT